MKKAASLIALTLPLACFGAWIDENGNPIPDTSSMRSSGDFGAQLILTASEQEFRRVWNSTSGTPKLQTTNKVRIGQSISGVILFSGCAPSPSQTCKVAAEFSVQAPDGKATPAGSGPVWSKAPPKPRIIMLGEASITLGFGNDDVQGTYTLVANVTDLVTKRTLKLSLPFSVTK